MKRMTWDHALPRSKFAGKHNLHTTPSLSHLQILLVIDPQKENRYAPGPQMFKQPPRDEHQRRFPSKDKSQEPAHCVGEDFERFLLADTIVVNVVDRDAKYVRFELDKGKEARVVEQNALCFCEWKRQGKEK